MRLLILAIAFIQLVSCVGPETEPMEKCTNENFYKFSFEISEDVESFDQVQVDVIGAWVVVDEVRYSLSIPNPLIIDKESNDQIYELDIGVVNELGYLDLEFQVGTTSIIRDDSGIYHPLEVTGVATENEDVFSVRVTMDRRCIDRSDSIPLEVSNYTVKINDGSYKFVIDDLKR